MAAFYTYNGKDCCVTKELIDGYYTRLLAERRVTSAGDTTALDFYLRHYAEVFRPLLELMAAGVRVDSAQRARRYDELVGRVSELKTQIVGAGADIFSTGKTAKGGISRKKLGTYLYETLGLPKQFVKDKKKGEKKVTTNEIAIRKLAHQFQIGRAHV